MFIKKFPVKLDGQAFKGQSTQEKCGFFAVVACLFTNVIRQKHYT